MHAALEPGALDSLRRLDGGAGEVLREVLEIFRDDAPELVLRIREAVMARSARRLRFAATLLTGSSANVGAAALACIALDLQQIAEREAMDRAVRPLDALMKEFERVAHEVDALLADGH
jgi:HPt (histidine-containing phosphotransfer) domain-containing protein